MKLNLYATPGACSLSCHIVLEWIGAPYKITYISGSERKESAFRKINPSGAVPVLEADDWVLTQNIAILNFLADNFPDTKLHGDGSAKSRAEVNRALALASSDLHPAFKPLFGTTAYLDDETSIEKTKINARNQLRNLFEIVDASLAGKDWITGARSIADPLLYAITRWTKNKGVDVNISGLSNLNRFMTNMDSDAGVQKALQDEGLEKFYRPEAE